MRLLLKSFNLGCYKSPTVTRTPGLIFLIFISLNLSGQEIHKTNVLFDGHSLAGWSVLPQADTSLWKTVDGSIAGGDGVRKIPRNTYLVTEKEYTDFEFRCLFRLTGDPQTGMLNSGIQYRSIVNNGNMTGYQADIGDGFWGNIYDEHRRKKLITGDLSVLELVLNRKGWNSYIIRCRGNQHELYINGVKTTEFIEKDPQIPSTGVIAIQLHSGGAARIEFRSITITELD
jgi:hypothetical protein